VDRAVLQSAWTITKSQRAGWVLTPPVGRSGRLRGQRRETLPAIRIHPANDEQLAPFWISVWPQIRQMSRSLPRASVIVKLSRNMPDISDKAADVAAHYD